MNRNLIALLIYCGLAVVVAQAREWTPSSELLRAVRMVESSDGLHRVGDDGESLGDYQLSEAAWLDVNAWRRARSLKTYPYNQTVFHRYISRVYASNYLTILHGELHRRMNRPPAAAELYAAYNMGLAAFAQCDFKLQRVHPVIRERCERITRLVAANGRM